MNSANETLQAIRNKKALITKKYNEARQKLQNKYNEDMNILQEEEKNWLEQFEEVPVNDIYKNKPRRYRKKPLIVEAYQTDHETEVLTLNGPTIAHAGDYILKDLKGREYPCSREVFEETYEEVKTDD